MPSNSIDHSDLTVLIIALIKRKEPRRVRSQSKKLYEMREVQCTCIEYSGFRTVDSIFSSIVVSIHPLCTHTTNPLLTNNQEHVGRQICGKTFVQARGCQ